MGGAGQRRQRSEAAKAAAARNPTVFGSGTADPALDQLHRAPGARIWVLVDAEVDGRAANDSREVIGGTANLSGFCTPIVIPPGPIRCNQQ